MENDASKWPDFLIHQKYFKRFQVILSFYRQIIVAQLGIQPCISPRT
jgi:hypothetical protein